MRKWINIRKNLIRTIFIITGCFGCLITGFILGKYPIFKVMCIIMTFSTFASFLLFVVAMEYTSSKVVVGLLIGVIGFSTVSL